MGVWQPDYCEQRAFAVHHFEDADYLVVVFGLREQRAVAVHQHMGP